MSVQRLRYLSEKTAAQLFRDVDGNVAKYLSGDFSGEAESSDWSLELQLEVDLESLSGLVGDRGMEAEVRNSLLVWQALSHMTPSLACENRIWTRLTHVECLAYTRARWLYGLLKENIPDAIRTHFFANTQTRYRDDNAISRLWWNAYISQLAIPEDHEGALRAMLKTADIRSNVIERSLVSSRPKIARGILRAIMTTPAITLTESAFRDFMKAVNRQGGGVLFELMDDSDVDKFMASCTT